MLVVYAVLAFSTEALAATVNSGIDAVGTSGVITADDGQHSSTDDDVDTPGKKGTKPQPTAPQSDNEPWTLTVCVAPDSESVGIDYFYVDPELGEEVVVHRLGCGRSTDDEALVEDTVLSYIRRLPMPVPHPKMSAEVGICGARHQLNLNIPSSVGIDPQETIFGGLDAYAYGEFEVNWGDGTIDRYRATGAEYPNSELVHSWSTKGHYQITVTANWSVDWTLGGYSGVISGLRTTASINDFSVGELQAVLLK